jgi:hypothetical protein
MKSYSLSGHFMIRRLSRMRISHDIPKRLRSSGVEIVLLDKDPAMRSLAKAILAKKKQNGRKCRDVITCFDPEMLERLRLTPGYQWVFVGHSAAVRQMSDRFQMGDSSDSIWLKPGNRSVGECSLKQISNLLCRHLKENVSGQPLNIKFYSCEMALSQHVYDSKGDYEITPISVKGSKPYITRKFGPNFFKELKAWKGIDNKVVQQTLLSSLDIIACNLAKTAKKCAASVVTIEAFVGPGFMDPKYKYKGLAWDPNEYYKLATAFSKASRAGEKGISHLPVIEMLDLSSAEIDDCVFNSKTAHRLRYFLDFPAWYKNEDSIERRPQAS